MAKTYRCTYVVDSKPAETSIGRVNKALSDSEKSSARLLAAMERAFTTAASKAGTLDAAIGKVAATSKRAEKSAEQIANAQGKAALKASQDWEKANAKVNALFASQATGAQKVADVSEDANTRTMVGLDKLRVSGLKLQDDLARAAEKRARVDQAATERAAAAKARLTRNELTDEEVAFRVKNRLVERGNKQRIDAAMKTADVEKQGFMSSIAGAAGLSSAMGGVALAAAGLRAGKTFVSAIASSFTEAHQAAEKLARMTLDTSKALRDIAAIKEKYFPTDEELEQHMKVRQAGGLDQQTAHDYQNELYNTLGTVGQEKFSEKERKDLEVRGARMVGRVAHNAGEAKNLATIMGLMPDYLPGKPSARQVVSEADAVYTILGKGAGSQQVSTEQYQKLLTGLTTEDKDMKGFLHDPRQAAALTAVSSKFGPEESRQSTMQAIRQLRGFTKLTKRKGTSSSLAASLKEMGLEESDDPIKAMTKLFQYADKNFKGKAFDVELARRGFGSTTDNRRLAQFYEQWRAGNFQRIVGMANQPIDPNLAEKKDVAFAKSLTGQDMMTQQQVEASKIEEGKRARLLAIEKQRAEAELIRERKIDVTPQAQLNQRMASLTTLGHREGRDVMIEERAIENMRKRKGLAAEAKPDWRMNPAGVAGYLGANRILRDRAAEMNELSRLPDVPPGEGLPAPAQINPMGRALPAPAAPGPQASVGMRPGATVASAGPNPAAGHDTLADLLKATRELIDINRRQLAANEKVAQHTERNGNRAPEPLMRPGIG